VTAAVGSTILELDGAPALSRLTTIVRDHVAVVDLPRIGAELYLAGPGGSTPVRILGTDRANGAIALGEGWEPETGAWTMVHVASPHHVPAALRGAAGAAGALLFAAPGHGRAVTGGDEMDSWGGESSLPAATLTCEAAPAYCAPCSGAAAPERASALALFPEA
jgi:small ligand-binding sensory domain FIST